MSGSQAWPTVAALEALAAAAERGLLRAPFGPMQLGRAIGRPEHASALAVLGRLDARGLSGEQLGAALRLAADARKEFEARSHTTLVWSDLDVPGSRDTHVVCNELFREAKANLLVSTYSLGHKAGADEEKGNPVLRPLAERMAATPGLEVRFFLNLRRLDHFAHASDRQIETAFMHWFRSEIWPWEPVPEIYYDPRSLDGASDETACLHAKCVVVDDQRAFVTSANLTEAAQDRNVEAGVLIDDPIFARLLRRQFESLIDRGHVRHLVHGS